jgi:hypothetical protein
MLDVNGLPGAQLQRFLEIPGNFFLAATCGQRGTPCGEKYRH